MLELLQVVAQVEGFSFLFLDEGTIPSSPYVNIPMRSIFQSFDAGYNRSQRLDNYFDQSKTTRHAVEEIFLRGKNPEVGVFDEATGTEIILS